MPVKALRKDGRESSFDEFHRCWQRVTVLTASGKVHSVRAAYLFVKLISVRGDLPSCFFEAFFTIQTKKC